MCEDGACTFHGAQQHSRTTYFATPAYEAKLSVMQAQAHNHALQWLDKQNPKPLGAPIECTCAAQSGVIGHAAFCPLGDGTAPEGTPESAG
jgi:hypothetical protein